MSLQSKTAMPAGIARKGKIGVVEGQQCEINPTMRESTATEARFRTYSPTILLWGKNPRRNADEKSF